MFFNPLMTPMIIIVSIDLLVYIVYMAPKHLAKAGYIGFSVIVWQNWDVNYLSLHYIYTTK